MDLMEKEQTLLDQWRSLPSEKQQDVLDFASSLQGKSKQNTPRRSALGVCADTKTVISREEIDDARNEMWRDFPRDIDK